MILRAIRWALLIAALSAAAIGTPAPGLFQVPMPPEIQRILQKAQSGQPLTKEEQGALTAWGKSMAGGAKNPAEERGAGQAAAPNDAAGQSGARSQRSRAPARPGAGPVMLARLYGSVSLSWSARDKRTVREEGGQGDDEYSEITFDYDAEASVSAELDGGLGPFGGQLYAKGTPGASKYHETMTRTKKEFRSGIEVSKHVTVTKFEIDGPALPFVVPTVGGEATSNCWASFWPAKRAMELMLTISFPVRWSVTEDGKELPGRAVPPKPILIKTFLAATAPPPPKIVPAGAGTQSDQTIRARGTWTGKTVGPWSWVEASSPLRAPMEPDILPKSPKDAVLPAGIKPELDTAGSGLGGPWAGKLDLEWELSSTDRVKAVPRAEPLEALRGKEVQLDGSDSEGRRLSYEWSFSASNCPEGISADGNARKQGAKVSFKPLCPTEVTLTVRNRISQDRKSIRVGVKPRPFHTDSSTSPEGILVACADDQGQVKPILPHGQGNWDQQVAWIGGRNICGLDADTCAPGHALHPLPQGGASSGGGTCRAGSCEGRTWKGGGYSLEPVRDPDGPFDGVWYVSDYTLQVNRQVLVNGYVLPGSKPMTRTSKNFYDANRDLKTDVDGYLAAIRKHEAHHTRVIGDQLRANDPGPKIEKMGTRGGAEGLQKKADDAICAAETAIIDASCALDAGPPGWGPQALGVLNIDTDRWVVVPGWTVRR